MSWAELTISRDPQALAAERIKAHRIAQECANREGISFWAYYSRYMHRYTWTFRGIDTFGAFCRDVVRFDPQEGRP